MKTLIISYDVREGGDYAAMYDAIRRVAHGEPEHPLQSVWIVQSATDANQVRNQLLAAISGRGKVVVAEVAAQAAA